METINIKSKLVQIFDATGATKEFPDTTKA